MLVRFAGRLFAVPFLLGISFFLFPSPVRASPLPDGPLVLGEIAWAGSSKSTADEWLELWNLGDLPIDLTGYRLLGAGGGDEGLSLDGFVIVPHSAFLVANYAAENEKSALAIDPHLVTSAVSLPNDTLFVRLINEDGDIVDEAGDGHAPPAGSTSPVKATMIRMPDGNWRTADRSERLDADVADYGTPGICDGCNWSDADLAGAEEAVETETDPVSLPEPETMIDAVEETSSEPVDESTGSPTSVIETETPPEPVSVSTVTTTTVTKPTPEPAAPSPDYPAFRLHRVFPAPPVGVREWVEIRLPKGANLDALHGYALYDETGRISSFPPADMTLVSVVGDIVRIELTSAKLNNGGDSVELRRPDGSVVERMTYPKTKTGERWTKNATATAWVLERVPEPEPAASTYAPPPPVIELPTIAESETVSSETSAPTTVAASSVKQPPTATAPATSASAPTPKPVTQKSPTTPAKTAASSAVKTTAAKTTSVAANKNAILPVTHDMLTRLNPNVRIAITGTVGSRPGLLNKHWYVLLSPDGLGLLVRGSSKQPTPAPGTTVRVTGTLTVNDDGLSIGVGANDTWTPVNGPVIHPLPRTVDLSAASIEDGWSLVDVQGTVRETKSTSVLLDLGDALVNVTIKSASGYRAARLKPGDMVRVRGLLDARGDEPSILIRAAQDVEILSHATLAAPSDPPKSLPLWLPFGAVGATYAVSQSYKRLKDLRSKSRIEALAQKARAVQGV